MTHSFDIHSVIEETISCGIDVGYLQEYFSKKDLDSPIMLLSKKRVRDNYFALKEALPRVKIHYAVKPNNHPAIINEIYEEAFGSHKPARATVAVKTLPKNALVEIDAVALVK